MRLLAVMSIGLAVSLGGCVNVLPEPEIPSALIALPPERAESPPNPLRADVAVYPPDASRAFAGVNIAVRSGQEIVYLADVRWADSPPRLLQGAVIDALSGADGDGRVAPAQLAASVDYDVRWRIVDLSAGRDTAPVRVEVEVSLVDSRSRRMVAQHAFRAEGSPASRAPRDRAAALAVAAQSVANQVAAFVATEAGPMTPLVPVAPPTN